MFTMKILWNPQIQYEDLMTVEGDAILGFKVLSEQSKLF